MLSLFMAMPSDVLVWLLKTPKRAEILEISAYPPYPCRHDHISFRPRFAALLPLA